MPPNEGRWRSGGGGAHEESVARWSQSEGPEKEGSQMSCIRLTHPRPNFYVSRLRTLGLAETSQRACDWKECGDRALSPQTLFGRRWRISMQQQSSDACRYSRLQEGPVDVPLAGWRSCRARGRWTGKVHDGDEGGAAVRALEGEGRRGEAGEEVGALCWREACPDRSRQPELTKS